MRRLTLIEFVVGLALTAVLLGAVMRLLQTVSVTTGRLEGGINQEYEKVYLQQQLAPIFAELTYGAFFMNSPGQLTFAYFRGVDVEPLFCGELFASLGVDDQQNLLLTTWPSASQWGDLRKPSRTLLLAEGVSALRFRFYIPPRPDDERIFLSTAEKPYRKNRSGWVQDWGQDEGGLPAMIEMTIERLGETTQMIFSPLHAREPIIYYERG